MIGRRSKLRKARTYLSYDELEIEEVAETGALNAEMVCLSNRDLFMRYDPEDAVVSELCLKKKIRQIHDSITQVQEIKTDYLRHILDRFFMTEREGRTENA
jgi:hypothetical protein